MPFTLPSVSSHSSPTCIALSDVLRTNNLTLVSSSSNGLVIPCGHTQGMVCYSFPMDFLIIVLLLQSSIRSYESNATPHRMLYSILMFNSYIPSDIP